jgi:magnesium-transporting ATPase (P-type)
MQDVKEAPLKKSKMENRVVNVFAFIVFIQFILCVILGILHGVNFLTVNHFYLNPPTYSAVGNSFIVFLTYLVLLNTLVPISLIISL